MNRAASAIKGRCWRSWRTPLASSSRQSTSSKALPFLPMRMYRISKRISRAPSDFYFISVQDTTVPYPTGAIDSDDHFVYDPTDKTRDNVVIEADSDHLITRWYTIPREPDQQCPPPNYRELYDVEKNIPINVPINAAHENFGLRIEPMIDTPTAPSCQTPWMSPYLPPEDKRDSQTTALGTSPKCASFRLDDRHFAVSMMRIILANKTKRASPSVLPPFLKFRRPFNWVSRQSNCQY
jgi:hypothetical protein